MINREITYERDVQKSYMKIPAVLESCLDETLMLRKDYSGILPVEKCYVNGGGQYWYNISGKQALDAYCRLNPINQDFFEMLILRICSQLEILEWNLIDTSCLVLDPELIFINHSGDEVSFILYPNSSGDFFDELQQLMEYLLTKLNHSDKEGVHGAYRIYEMILTKGYSISDLKRTILEREEKLEVKAEERLVRKEKPIEISKNETIKEISNIEITREKELDIFQQIENKIQELIERAKAILWKKVQKEDIPQSVNPEDEIEEETVVIRPTVCLAEVLSEPRGELIYEGVEGYADFELEKDSCIIGKNPKANLYINRDTVSQFHAKIDYLTKTYYIEDMNSTNGTFVNDELLNYKEKRALSQGDVIRFADVKYRFM